MGQSEVVAWAALGIGMSALLLGLRKSDIARARPAPAVEAAAGELTSLRAELTRLRSEHAQARLALQQACSEDDDPASAEDDESAPSSAGDQEALRVPSHQEYWDELDERFAAEPLDPRWNAKAELVESTSRALPDGSSVRSLECRQSMCRLETWHDSEETYHEFVAKFSLLGTDAPLWRGPSVFHVLHTPSHEGDPLKAAAFLGRDTLPSAGQPR